MGGKAIDELGELQQAVMEAVWKLDEATVQQVREALRRKPPLAYTTVLSVMQKLEKAGLLKHRAEGRAYVYRPARSREAAGRHSLRQFIEKVFKSDPKLLFQHLLDDEQLTDAELAELQRMIDQRRKELRDA